MFDKLKELMQIKNQMAKIKKELDDTVIERTSADELIKIFISGSQEIKKVEISGDLNKYPTSKLEDIIKDVINDSIKSSQREAANKMGAISDLGKLPKA